MQKRPVETNTNSLKKQDQLFMVVVFFWIFMAKNVMTE